MKSFPSMRRRAGSAVVLASVAALVAGFMTLATAFGPDRAEAQEFACSNSSVQVVQTRSVAFAILRFTGAGVVIEVDSGDPRTFNLHPLTKLWLVERQCALAAGLGDAPQQGDLGYLVFSAAQHRDADCAAFDRIAEQAGGNARNALLTINGDVSRRERPRDFYCDQGLGICSQIRDISADGC